MRSNAPVIRPHFSIARRMIIVAGGGQRAPDAGTVGRLVAMELTTLSLKVPETYRPFTVSSGVRTSALKYPDRVALRHGRAERTYRELVARIDALAATANGTLGLEPGQHVGVFGPNCIEFIEAVLALSDAGSPVVTLSGRLNRAELIEICDDACIKVLFVHRDCAPVAQGAAFATVERLIVFGPEYEALLNNGPGQPYLPVAGEWDIFSIPYTSGTTGRPKGVLLPHRARALLFYAMAVEYGCFGPEDSFLALAPLAHGAGFAFAVAPIFFGGTCELLDAFDAAQVVQRLRDGRFTGVFMVPTHLHAIFSLPAEFLAEHRDIALKSLICNAAPLPQRVKERIVEQWGRHLLHETYGSTEVGIACNIRPVDQLRKQSCVGLAFPNCAIELRGPDGREVAANEIGELYTNSPFLFSGYWQQGRAVPPPLQRGWFSAGDLARKDGEGFIHIVDRKSDMVISGGINIYPRQIEEVLYRHPQVAEAAVVGVADEKWGERLRAYIVPRGAGRPDAESITAFCRTDLSSYKVPREIVFLDELPKNATGKILKRRLREA